MSDTAGTVHSPRTTRLDETLERLRPALYETLRTLVSIPSENRPPHGAEQECQARVAGWLRDLGLKPDLYPISSVAGLEAHPEYWRGRDYSNRPNVNAVWKGGGGGRSLVLSGHIDTVPADTPVEWKHPYFGAVVEDGRLFGRGAFDMKAGVAMNLTVLRALRELNATLAGDVTFETVVDEEFGGVNGTLAARVRGYLADAAVIGEPTALRICPAQRGGRVIHITFHGDGGILSVNKPQARVMDQVTYVLGRLQEFAALRQARGQIHPYYATCAEPFAVWVTNIATGRWGWTEPITIPELCRLELYWQAMPDETREHVEGDFFEWWRAVLAARPDLFGTAPTLELPMRFLPGSAIPRDSPLVNSFSQAAANCGIEPVVEGMDSPADMYIFQRCFQMPALMWGPAGGHAHQADEFVDLESLFQATRTLLRFVCGWCGAEFPR